MTQTDAWVSGPVKTVLDKDTIKPGIPCLDQYFWDLYPRLVILGTAKESCFPEAQQSHINVRGMKKQPQQCSQHWRLGLCSWSRAQSTHARFILGKEPSSAAPATRAGAMPRRGAVNSNKTTFIRVWFEKSVSKITLTLCHRCVHTSFLKGNEMNLRSIYPLVKYKQFLMDLQLTLVTDSLLAAGMITYSLASTRRRRCLQCVIPETWYFSMLVGDQIFKSAQFSCK